jgi:hypothetical protein
LRKNIKFDIFVGDDTGLLKKVKMIYNYQTEVHGTIKGSSKKDGIEIDEEEEEALKRQRLTDEGEIAEIKEKVR